MFSIASSMSPFASVSAFAIHHACAGTLTQLFYQGCGNFSHSKILERFDLPGIKPHRYKSEKGAIYRPLTKRDTTWSIRALLHISSRRRVAFTRSSRSLTDVSSGNSRACRLPATRTILGVIKPYYSASTKLSSAWKPDPENGLHERLQRQRPGTG